MKQVKQFLENLLNRWNQPKPTEEEIKANTMMLVCFKDQPTEKVIDTLILFDAMAKKRLIEIKQQAETDKFVSDFYLGTSNKSKKVTI